MLPRSAQDARRRMPNGTYGGVGGKGAKETSRSPTYPIVFSLYNNVYG